MLHLLFSLLYLLSINTLVFAGLPDSVEYFGRFRPNGESFISDWPGSGIRFHLEQQSNEDVKITAAFDGCQNNCKFFVGVLVNCQEILKYEINSQSPSFTHTILSNGKSNQIFSIELKKLTEANDYDAVGNMSPKDLVVEGASFISADKVNIPGCFPKQSKLLFFGDSLTAAYGVDGISPCSFTAQTEDVNHGYAHIIANRLQSEIHTVAWSGRGVVRNYGDVNPTSSDGTLPYLYNRTIATDSVSGSKEDGNYWKPSNYAANVITIMLGSNDYSTSPRPSDEQFITGYVNFVSMIQHDYPKAQILALCAPYGYEDVQCNNIEAAAKQTQIQFFAIPDSAWDSGLGCDTHPNIQSQISMADAVTPVIKALLL